MAALSAVALLQAPIRLRGIQLGRPTDLLLDVEAWQVVGFVVHCGDDTPRFLPYAASQPATEEIAVASALMLLEDVAFYEKRGVSFRSLTGGDVARHGALRDVLIGPGGAIAELEVERDGSRHRIPAAGATVVPTRASAA
ncbi:MAG: hypothetical protein QOF43_2413 [Gaiellaceae bacterium]|jgi:hypothetical protein|nr:hypothetical protein [Gaiellaceae bacterium]